MAEYAKSYESLAMIWRVLAEHSGPDKPMSIKEIVEALPRREKATDAIGGQNVPSAKTVERILADQLDTMEALFPGFRVMTEHEHPELLGCYVSDRKLHVVLEDREGEPLANGEMLAIVSPEQGIAPKYSTIDGMLQAVADSCEKKELVSRLPMRLACVAAKTSGGTVEYIPYGKAMESRAKARQGRAEQGKDPNNVARRYYLESVLKPSQWQMLTDLIKVYPYIGEKQTNTLLSKLEKVFPGCSESVGARYAFKQENKNLFENLRELDRAIRLKQKVSLEYGVWKLKKQGANGWRPALETSVTARMSEEEKKYRRIVFEPYALMWSNGYYYLVGRHRDMMNLRVDRIRGEVKRLPDHFEVPEKFDPVSYRDRSPVMYPGEQEIIRMRCHVSMVSVIMDVFGVKAEYTAPEDDYTDVTVYVSPAGAKLFAMQYAEKVEVLEPASLREDVRKSLSAAAEKYKE